MKRATPLLDLRPPYGSRILSYAVRDLDPIALLQFVPLRLIDPHIDLTSIVDHSDVYDPLFVIGRPRILRGSRFILTRNLLILAAIALVLTLLSRSGNVFQRTRRMLVVRCFADLGRGDVLLPDNPRLAALFVATGEAQAHDEPRDEAEHYSQNVRGKM